MVYVTCAYRQTFTVFKLERLGALTRRGFFRYYVPRYTPISHPKGLNITR